MALFDTLIREVAEKFSLGGNAEKLVIELVRAMSSPQTGGLAGFLDKFRQAGLAELVQSWIGRGENLPLTPSQTEQALGRGFLDQIAGRLGLSVSSLTAPIAFVIPKIINLLTPDGVVPATLPAGVTSLLAGSTETARRAEEEGKSFLGRYWWLLALVALLAIAGWFSFLRPEQKVVTAPSPAVPTTPTPPVVPKAQVEPRLSITNTNGQVRYGGVVRDEASRTTILDNLKKVFGEGNIFGTIAVDPNAGPAAWLDKLGAALDKFKLSGVEALFEGASAWIGGAISDVQRSNLIEQLKGIFGSTMSFGSLTDRADAAIKSATDKTLAAIAALKPGFTGSDLVKALNLSIIHFETGSAALSKDAHELLQKLATAIKAAPAGTKIEVGGHTDSTGDAATHEPLSQARAESVRTTLIEYGVAPDILVAKGYGASQPVASNDTPDGRFQNRRIEFIIIQ
ncbi:MAG: YidB family protein [Rhodospirillales bacterium]